jgi:hypothetical protein
MSLNSSTHEQMVFGGIPPTVHEDRTTENKSIVLSGPVFSSGDKSSIYGLDISCHDIKTACPEIVNSKTGEVMQSIYGDIVTELRAQLNRAQLKNALGRYRSISAGVRIRRARDSVARRYRSRKNLHCPLFDGCHTDSQLASELTDVIIPEFQSFFRIGGTFAHESQESQASLHDRPTL